MAAKIAEVAACDQYAAPVAAVVERERSDLPTLGVVTPVAEEVVAEAFALGGFEKARRDDLVGIYVFRADGHRPRRESFEFGYGHFS